MNQTDTQMLIRESAGIPFYGRISFFYFKVLR